MSAAITAAVVGVAGSAYVSSQNNKAAAKRAAAAGNGSDLSSQIASEQWERYQELYNPLEEKMVKDAENYGSDENYARAAGDASATVASQYGKARDQLNRTPGLDPSSAAYQSSMIGLGLNQAASDATAQNLARKNVTDTAYSRKMSALGLGKGLDTTAAQGANAASSAALNQAYQQNQLGASNASAWGTGISNIFNAASKSGLFSASSGGGTANVGALNSGGGSSSFNYATDTPTDLGGTSFI